MASPVNERRIKDVQAKATGAMANADTAANSNSIDLVQTTPFPTTERVLVRLSQTALAVATNNKNVNVRLQDSADDSTFANVARVANPAMVTTGLNSVLGSNSIDLTLPSNVRRYIRAVSAGEANGPDGSAGTTTIELLF